MNIFEIFRSAANPQKAAPMSAYMRGQFPFLDIQKPERKKLSRDFIKMKQIFAFAGILVPVLLIAGCIAQNSSEHKTPAITEERIAIAPQTLSEHEPSISHDEIPERTKVEYIKITPQEARHMISRGGVIILDVRTRREYDEGHIKDAVLLPDNEIADNVKNVIADKNQTILVYCRSGARSARASRTLINLGYEKVYDLGGIENWTGEIVRR